MTNSNNPKKRKPLITYGKRTRPQRSLPLSSDGGIDDMAFVAHSEDVDLEQKPPPPPPRKPVSQKAASMPSEPDEKMVTEMQEILGMDRADAVRYLKAKNNNMEAAINAVLNQEDISKIEQATQWDESLWSAGKEGAAANALAGDPNDQYLRPLASSAAATRPNSPAPSQRSNLHPSSKQEEDDDIAKAMAMSRGEYEGSFQGQESGIVGGGGAVFGPANREHYERDQWAMVPVGGGRHESNEVIPDAQPDQRVHSAGEPRLLKPLPGGDYTPNLLAICGVIDGAREALLMREHVQENYGSDAEWWRGHPISMPKIVHVNDGTPAEPESDDQDEILAEVQRLMALLRASGRSYASVSALTQTNAIKKTSPNSTQSRTLLELFLQSWTEAAAAKAREPEAITNLFSTTVGTNAAEGMDTPDLSLINLQVALPEDTKSDLFELLDGLLWDTDAENGAMADNYIERPADVLVMRVHQASAAMGNQLRVEVPPDFYVDKYLKENIEATRATRVKMAESKKRIKQIEDIEKRLKTWKHPKKNESVDAMEMLKHTLGHFNGQNKLKVATAEAEKSNNPPPTTDNAEDQPPHYPEVSAKLEKIIANIDSKLTLLDSEKEKIRMAISEMHKTAPSGLQEDQKHHYLLRGVATKPNITYVLAPVEGDEQSDEMFDDEKSSKGFRWWRMEYEVNASGSGAKITKTKAYDYDVLRAVELEHFSALLVYASDRVNYPSTPSSEISEDNIDLPRPLKDFIKRDNELFLSELKTATSTADPPAYDLMDNDIPHQSIERTSMDSTCVEGGGSDFGGPSPPGYEDDGFMGRHEFGMPPDIKQGGFDPSYTGDVAYGQMEEDAPVHEIKLDDRVGDSGEDDIGEMEVEMVEKRHEPLIPGLKDTSMEGAESQQK